MGVCVWEGCGEGEWEGLCVSVNVYRLQHVGISLKIL